ncbi:MAG: phenylalanine--tRNA ligase subunit alpha [Candidatus Micrarchaeota archaeon]
MTLSLQEKKVLVVLNSSGKQDTAQLSKSSGLKEDAVNRATIMLFSKGLVKIDEDVQEDISLGEEGKKYLENGLPERKIIDFVGDEEKTVEECATHIGEQFQIGVIWLRKHNFAIIIQGKIKLTPEGLKYKKSKLLQEIVLERISKREPISPPSLKKVLLELKKRGSIIRTIEVKTRLFEITDLGKKEVGGGLSLEEETSQLTQKMIVSGSWKNTKLRKYDVTAEAPTINPGKKQPYYEFLDEVREKITAMGFKEMRGELVQTEFWDFDALYVPQFHPNRTPKATYYLKSPKHGSISDGDLFEKVKKSHETGTEESSGWQYEWDETKALTLVGRTETTALTGKYLLNEKKYPARYFSIGRNLRYDVIDATHLPDFDQLEGFVADESLTLRDLLGQLESFAIEVAGIKNPKNIRFKAAYFPFTEPSVELFAKHPVLGWMELGGSGMFRPEMLKPLGVDVPVIAWSMGLGRLAMFRLGIKHIKDLFSQDVKFLQEHAYR